jgi:hypothetical protein
VPQNDQRHAEGRLDFLQCLARARLRQRDLLGGRQERSVHTQRDQEPQLFQLEPGDDRVE